MPLTKFSVTLHVYTSVNLRNLNNHEDVSISIHLELSDNHLSLVGSVQYTCPVVPLCIADALCTNMSISVYFCMLK